MIKRLKLKFILINMFIVTVMLLVIFGMVLGSTRANMEQESIRTMQLLLEENKILINVPGQPAEAVRLPFFLASLDHSGHLVAVIGGYYDLSDKEALTGIISHAYSGGERIGELKAYNLRFCRKDTPFGTKMVFVDSSSEKAAISGLIQSSMMVGGISFVIFLGISFLLAGWAVRPVEKAWNQQRQFVADASHELKTPLTVIMTTAEMLSGESCEEEQKGQMVNNILTMSRQMRELVENLLDLARADNGTAKLEFETLDFSVLLSDALLPFEPMYFEKGLTLESQIQEGLSLRGSAAHLKQVADILLDNALKYSTPGGTVILRARRLGGSCLLSVASPGEAISKADRTHIFKRFYRIDKARTGESYGLGLAIAQSIVSDHGGKIWAESNWGINTFFVQLPVQ